MIGLLLFYLTLRIRKSGTQLAHKVPAVFTLAVLAFSVGCRETETVVDKQDGAVVAAAKPIKRVEPTHSVVAEPVMTSSPAAKSLSQDPATASPESVCEAFIHRLQHGDRIGAENLLTRAALTTTQRANLTLEPICGRDATITTRPAGSKHQGKRAAQVECIIAETIDGEETTFSTTWQVGNQTKKGWRVSGMLVPLDESNRMQLLSFESIDDVATIKLLAAGEAIADDATPSRRRSQKVRQAEANEQHTSLQ